MIYLVCREGSNKDRLDTLLPQKKEWTIRSVWSKTALITGSVERADLMPLEETKIILCQSPIVYFNLRPIYLQNTLLKARLKTRFLFG